MNTTTRRNSTGRMILAMIIGTIFGELCVAAGAPYWSLPVGFGTGCASAWLLLRV